MTFPSATPRWRRYLRFWRADPQRDVDDELRFHFDMRIDDLVAEGLTESEARAKALEEFGEVADVRATLVAIDRRVVRTRAWSERLVDVANDIRYAARTLRRSPGLSLGIVLTLALGVGGNAAMFALLDTLFIRPPAGVSSPRDVHRIWAERKYSEGVQFSQIMSYGEYRALDEAASGRSRTTVYRPPQPTKIGSGESSVRARVSYAPASYFSLLGVRAEVGRIYSGEEDLVSNAAPVAVISDAYWRRELKVDSLVVGRSIEISGRTVTVIGVAARAFTGIDLDATDIWLPLGNYGRRDPNGTPWWLNPNVNGLFVLSRPTGAATALEIEQRLTQALRHVTHGGRVDSETVVRLGSIVAANGPGKREQEVQIAERLAGVAIVVLLIACANVANLLLARAVKRRREIAVRLALGISHARLVRLLLVEVMLLAVTTAVVSIGVAMFGGATLRRLLFPDIQWAHSAVDWPVVLFAFACALVAGLLAGIVPALQAATPELTNALKSAGGSGQGHRSRLRGALVASQAALSVVLLVGAGLFVRSLSNVRDLDLGFDAHNLITATVQYDNVRRGSDASFGPRLAALAGRIATLPGVEKTALTSTRPMYGFSTMMYYTDTDSLGSRPQWMPTVTAVSRGYFDAAGLHLVRGQDFEPVGSGSGPEVIVNDAMARRMWPGRNPIGECMRLERRDSPCYRIRAIVQDSRMGRIIEEPEPKFYISLDQIPERGRTYLGAYYAAVRVTPGHAASVTSDIRALIRQQFPSGFPEVVRLSDYVEPQFRPWQLGATLFTMFGALALIVAAIGTYSTVAYSVSQRTHEFGVRLALGARMRDVLGHVVGGGVRVVGIGVVCGILLALGAGRMVSTLLYGIAPNDPGVLACVAAILFAIAILAALAPAWRASRVDPVTALRAD